MSSVAASSPRLLGPYCLLRPLAEGGMGAVHIATALDEPGERLCLIKTLKPGVGQGSDEYLRRFLDEARVAVRLQGEHLCHMFDAGEADGELFLAMELIEGVTFRRLAERLEETQTPLPPAQASPSASACSRGCTPPTTPATIAASPSASCTGTCRRRTSWWTASVR